MRSGSAMQPCLLDLLSLALVYQNGVREALLKRHGQGETPINCGKMVISEGKLVTWCMAQRYFLLFLSLFELLIEISLILSRR